MYRTIIILTICLFPFLSNAQWDEEFLPTGRAQINSFTIDDNIYFVGGSLSGVERHFQIDVYNVTSETWNTIDLPNGTFGQRSLAIGNKIYFSDVEGDRTIYVYDTVTEEWSDFPARGFVEELTYMDSLLIILSSGDLDIYNLNTGEWTEFDFPYNTGATVIATQGKIAIGGGDFDLVRIYDVATDSWSQANLSSKRDDLRGLAFENRMFFIGGEEPGFNWSKRIDIYDVTTDSWSIDSISSNRLRFDVTIHDNKLYIAGGQRIGLSNQFRDELDVYDLQTNTWEYFNMPTGRRYPTVVGHADKIYIAGGDTQNENNVDIIEILEIETSSSEDIEYSDIKIFPNPVHNQLNINSERKIKSIRLYDVRGQLLQTLLLSENNSKSIDVSYLNSGTYFLSINDSSQLVRFVKL